MPPKKQQDSGVDIQPIKIQQVRLCILGFSPLIFNRQSAKAQRELLFPAGEKNKAAKRQTLKHDPVREYRDSMYVDPVKTASTLLTFPAPGFKGAAMTAALEIPGATKSSIGRLIRVDGYHVRIWGTPMIHMCGVKTMGMNRTPDIRTRAILPEWATQISVSFPEASLTASSIANLFAAAGQICGVGDFRQEKGKGSFGLFKIVNETDANFKRIIKTQGRKAQQDGFDNPEAYDSETAELWQWFEQEVISRGREKDATLVQ